MGACADSRMLATSEILTVWPAWLQPEPIKTERVKPVAACRQKQNTRTVSRSEAGSIRNPKRPKPLKAWGEIVNFGESGATEFGSKLGSLHLRANVPLVRG